MYKVYRKMPSGFWKYTEPFNSILDPEYHSLINHLTADKIDYVVIRPDSSILSSSSDDASNDYLSKLKAS